MSKQGSDGVQLRSDATASTRLDWVDSAKGLAILLVVLFHSGRILHQAELIGPAWLELNSVIATLRMPLFFAASGLFLASVVRRPWFDLWRTRLSLLTWVFIVWVGLRFTFFSIWPLPSRPSESNWDRITEALYAPINGLWFLHALVVFTVLAKLSSGIAVRWQLLGALAMFYAVQGPFTPSEVHYERLGTYYLYFIGACLLRAPLQALVQRSARQWFAPLTVALGGVGVLIAVLPQAWVLMPAVGTFSIVFGFMTAYHLQDTVAGRTLRWFGVRTLPIYVTHCIVIGAITTHLLRTGTSLHGFAQVWALPLISAVAIAISLALWEALRRGGLDWLYRAPSWFARRPASACSYTALTDAAAEVRRRQLMRSERGAFQLQ